MFDDGTSRFRIVRTGSAAPAGERAVVVPNAIDLAAATDLGHISGVRWVGHRPSTTPDAVLSSLVDAFSFRMEDVEEGVDGLRTPQAGALHAVLGHWTTGSTQPVTVVMPTGTGKTDAMLALFAHSRLRRLLVLVPSDALRDQIGERFETFGVLKKYGVVSPSALFPIVGRLCHRFDSEESARTFASGCNVVIATPNVLASMGEGIRNEFLAEFSDLFIDEAHHVAAETWRQVRDAFDGRRVVQFTATPFRQDGRHLGGKLLYAFPLREAQRQQYFSVINYLPVAEFEETDRSIAVTAIDLLRADLTAGRDHLLMARVRRRGRADDVLAIYHELAPDLAPRALYSGMPKRDLNVARDALRLRTTKVIVCVDMLGEGFDLPQLKIAAIHDPHKSLGVTLQFVGRFARTSGESIGEATVVVGRPDLDYDNTLRKLYSEDADWNLLIRDLSETAVGVQSDISEFDDGFQSVPDEVSMRSLLPKMSTVVYRNVNHWDPEAVTAVFPEETLLTYPYAVNTKERVLWFVTELRQEAQWGDVKSVEEVTHDLYIVYHDADHRLLYLNSSNKESGLEDLAKAIGGDQVIRVKGEAVFRAMAGVSRLVPTNVGVLDVRNRSRSFSMFAGANVSEGFPIVEAQTKTKTNIFAYGFEEGQRVSVGASLKGRIWSNRVAGSLKEWVDWCDHIGSKVTDERLIVDDVIASFIRPKEIDARPPFVVLALEWPWEIFVNTSDEIRIGSDAEGRTWPLMDAELVVTSSSTTGPIPFSVTVEDQAWKYTLDFHDGAMLIQAVGEEAQVVTSRRITPLSDYLTKRRGLTVLLEQDATIIPPGLLLQVNRELPPYRPEDLRVLDWGGIDLRKESQGPNRDADSIQARMIQELLADGTWEVLLDDDGSGEIADIVALKATDKELVVRLVHCKYSTPPAGARIEDFYALCGQAQKSVRWRRNMPLMFRRLIRREKGRLGRSHPSGFMHGTGKHLIDLEERSHLLRPRFEIHIAQPGLSAARVSAAILELLASTDTYVREAALADFALYCNA